MNAPIGNFESETAVPSTKKGKGRAEKAGIPQMPWRDPVRGKRLLIVIMRTYIAQEGHIKKVPTMDLHWQIISDLCFKQPEFSGLQGSSNSLKTQFEKTLLSRAHFHGWLDEFGGVTSNLSDKAGELDELDALVKQILQAKEVEDEKRRQALMTTEKINNLELIVLKNGLTGSSRIKRQEDVTTPSKPPSAAVTSPGGKGGSPSSIGGLIDQEILMHLKAVGTKRNKNAVTKDESEIEQRLLTKFEYYNGATFLAEANILHRAMRWKYLLKISLCQ